MRRVGRRASALSAFSVVGSSFSPAFPDEPFLGPQPAAAPLGMPAVGQGAFVFFLRPQGVFVSFVERLF